MMATDELTEDENLCLEAVQEQGTVYADDVLRYVRQEYEKDWSKAKATRILSRLARSGVIRRLPRASAGWGKGWYPSAYTVGRPTTH